MFKQIGQAIRKALAAALSRMQRSMRPSIEVKLTRHYLCLSLPQRLGGEFHLLPRRELAGPWRFSVASESQSFILQMTNATGSKVKLAHFPDEATARLALAKLSQVLINKRMTKWLWRLSLLCLIGGWIGHDNSPIQPPSTKALLADRSLDAALSTANLQSPTPYRNENKSAPPADELAKDLSQQIIAAQANAKYVRLASASQYELGNHALASNPDISEINQPSAGCNPKFAFEVARP